MDYIILSDWLKSTVSGIILLGAVGSILAAAILWLANRFLLPQVKSYSTKFLTAIVLHFVAPAVTQHVNLYFLQAKDKVQLFYAFQILKVIFALFFSLCSFMVFLFSVTTAGGDLFRASVITPLVLAFLCLWIALRYLAIVLVPMYSNIDKRIQNSVEDILTSKSKKSA